MRVALKNPTDLIPCPARALLAQLDRASDYESEGRWFESSRARQFYSQFRKILPLFPAWRDGRVAEGGGLLNRYTAQKLYRGFESPSLRSFLCELGGAKIRMTAASFLCELCKQRFT